MRFSVYVPLVLCVLLAWGAPFVARSLAPALAARALTAAVVILAAAAAWSAGLLAAAGLLRTHEVAREGGLSSSAVGALDQIPRSASLVASLALLAAGVAVTVTLLRRQRVMGELRELAASGQSAGDLVVVPTSSPLALALPGRRAQVLVSRGLLRALDDRERRVLLAHERCHIHHRHDLYRGACLLAGRLNPLLSGVGSDVDYALERWADEDAAATVADRAVAARALAKAALLAPLRPHSPIALAFERLRLRDRVVALQTSCPTTRRDALVALGVLAAIGTAAATDATLALAHIALAGTRF